jgi:hypothetical protein
MKFVCKEMERFTYREGFEEFEENHKKDVKELLSGSLFNGNKVNSSAIKLSKIVDLDNDPTGIHFSNGRFDLLSQSFSPRPDPFSSGLYITKCIDYEFTANDTTENMIEMMHTVLSQVFLQPEALEFITFEVAKSIICAPVDNCHFLFLVGEGSAGKTTLTDFLHVCLTDTYAKRTASNAFCEGNREAQILLNTLEPQQRFIFVDDPPHKPMSSSIIKTLCNGEISCRVLHANGSKTIKVNAKLLITSNHSLSFDEDDSGIRRRMMYYECRSKFTPDPNKVNDINVFLAETFSFDTFSDLENTAIFFYFARKCPFVSSYQSPPPCFLTGDNVHSFRSFANELFIPRAGRTVSATEVFQAVALYFPCFEFNRKEIVTQLDDIQDMKDTKVGKSKGAFANVMFNAENLQRLQNNQPLLREDGTESALII